VSDVKIQIRENGPYIVFGEFELVDPEGNPVPRPTGKPTVALCRCGGSLNKPFCDGTHSQIGFQGASRAVAEAEDEAGGAEGAPG
jgi:CDGSH-type Zn-finger protein